MLAVAFVDAGHWVALCPRPFCGGAEHFGPHRTTGYVGGLTPRGFRCENCELSCGVQWPPNVDDIDFILAMRPVPDTRNWTPDETVHDLLRENFRHGLVLQPLSIVGDHVVGPALTRRGAAAIGGGR